MVQHMFQMTDVVSNFFLIIIIKPMTASPIILLFSDDEVFEHKHIYCCSLSMCTLRVFVCV